MNYNHLTIAGRLAADAETKQSASGVQFANLHIGSNCGWGDKQKTLWMRATVFGKAAEFAGKLRKGDEVLLAGNIEPNEWTDKDGNKHVDTVMIAQTVQRVTAERAGGSPASSPRAVPERSTGSPPAPRQQQSDEEVPF